MLYIGWVLLSILYTVQTPVYNKFMITSAQSVEKQIMMATSGPESQSNNGNGTAAFTLSRHLCIPICLKIGTLSAAHPFHAVPNSEKYINPQLFQKLSNISSNSELFISVKVLDKNNNDISCAVQTPYRAFSSNRRKWDCCVKLPLDYNQCGYDAYLEMAFYEIVKCKPQRFAVGYLSLFDHATGALRKGAHKIPVYHHQHPVEYRQVTCTDSLEQRVLRYKNGEVSRNTWLDAWALPALERETERRRSIQEDGVKEAPYYLHMELPNFSLPVVYSDAEAVPQLAAKSSETPAPAGGAVISTVMATTTEIATHRVHDADFEIHATDHVPPQTPVERKFAMLATNINNNSLLDKEVKPSPATRDELWRILRKPSSASLSDHERRMLWNYRFYFSKASPPPADEPAATAPSQVARQFLTKFLKCFNWENERELDHVFKEILPFWTPDAIDIGDALELLSSHFNPYNLTVGLRRRAPATAPAPAANSDPAAAHAAASTPTSAFPASAASAASAAASADDPRIDKIFSYAMELRRFAVTRLTLASADELQLYLLQLVQALKHETLSSGSDPLKTAPLALFLIDRAVTNAVLGNFFYWFVKVENEDQLKNPPHQVNKRIFAVVLNAYIDLLKAHCSRTKSRSYKHLKRQIAFIKKLTGLVELIRKSFKRGDATSKKVQFLREYLADTSNEMLRFPEPFPLPLDPTVMICGCYPEECSVFKSSLSPLKITFKTVIPPDPHSTAASNIFAQKKHGKFALMFKIGDDLRQDQLVIQIINLMDQLLKNENLDLRLTPYKILATSPVAGLIQFVDNVTLDSVLSAADPPDAPSQLNGILKYLQRHSNVHSEISSAEEPQSLSVLGTKKNSVPLRNQQHAVASDLGVSPHLMDNYVKSCAGYCVITYLLGVGDRHLDNLLLSPNGKFWHADFGYILGRDPKPFPPLMKLPIQMIDGMGGMDHENFNVFKNYCFITYTTLRRNSNLILNLFQLMLDANIPDIQIDPARTVEKVQEKFALEMTEEEAILHFQNLIIDSVNAFLPMVIDALHSLAQYWRA